MSPVAKLMIVLNLLASVAFLAAAMFLVRYAEEYKPDIIIERVARLKDVQERKKIHDEQKAQVARLERALGEYEGWIDEKEDYVTEQVGRVREQETLLQQKRENLEDWKHKLELRRRRLDWRMWDNLYLNNRYDELERRLDEKKILKIDADNRAIMFADRRERLERDYYDLDYQLMRARQERIRVRRDLVDVMEQVPPEIIIYPGGEIPARPINARVIYVSDNREVFMLSVGREEGVRRGYRFTIHRGGEYVSQVRVGLVWQEFCQVEELDDMHRMDIQVGDDASTHLSIHPGTWSPLHPLPESAHPHGRRER